MVEGGHHSCIAPERQISCTIAGASKLNSCPIEYMLVCIVHVYVHVHLGIIAGYLCARERGSEE